MPAAGKHQLRRGVQWGLVLACLALSGLLFHARGRPPGVGDSIRAAFTIVPKDQFACQCAFPRAMTHHCRFQLEPNGAVRSGDMGKDANWAPYWTTDRNLYVVEGLFDDPDVQRAAERQSKLPEPEQRFVAWCTVELIARVDDGKVRFPGETGWSKILPTWLVHPRGCTAR